MTSQRVFMTCGMFILDRFEYLDAQGEPTGREAEEQIGGGGTYAAIGARMWLPADQISMIIDRGNDFPTQVQEVLDAYGSDTWIYRDHQDRGTTRALNLYRGEHRDFKYLTPRIRITPKDFMRSSLAKYLHFICSPTRAAEIIKAVDEINDWDPVTIYEPIPDRCIPSELPALLQVLPRINVLSPNASEACTLLSMNTDEPITRNIIQNAASLLYASRAKAGANQGIVIRSGELGAYVKNSDDPGLWIDAYWTERDSEKVVDVTGAGNAFLGGLAAGLHLCDGDIRKAAAHATISASFTIEQHGLPTLTEGLWNGDGPSNRLLPRNV